MRDHVSAPRGSGGPRRTAPGAPRPVTGPPMAPPAAPSAAASPAPAVAPSAAGTTARAGAAAQTPPAPPHTAPHAPPAGAAVPHPVPRPPRARPQGGRLAAVVVSHNRLGQLRRTVRRLLQEGVDHLVVVDNASSDGTRDWLAQLRDPRVHVVLSERNRGGAGGFEHGLRTARALHDADWYLVMDDDARPHPGTLARFRALAAHQQTGQPQDSPPPGTLPAHPASSTGPVLEAVAGGVFYPDGEICETNRPARNPFRCRRSFWRTVLGGGRAGFHVADAEYDASTPVRVDTASFVGLFLSRAALDRAGYPRGGLFIYGDDVLYTLELSGAGGRIGFAPWLGFEHDCTTFRRGEGQVHRPLWKVYYNYRNGLFAYRKAAGPVLFWPVLAITLPKWLLKLRGYSPAERPVFLRLLALAVRDGLMGRADRPHRQIRARARLLAAGQAQRQSPQQSPHQTAPAAPPSTAAGPDRIQTPAGSDRGQAAAPAPTPVMPAPPVQPPVAQAPVIQTAAAPAPSGPEDAIPDPPRTPASLS